jgi:hypothetical protein
MLARRALPAISRIVLWKKRFSRTSSRSSSSGSKGVEPLAALA